MAKKQKTLIIVESPNKIATIQKYLGENYIIRASYGHIMELRSGKSAGIGVDVENGFKLKYGFLKDKKSQIQSIIDAAEMCDLILLGTDADREGECISAHLYSIVESSGKPIKRIKFTEITKPALLKAIKNAGDIDQNLLKAQEARRAIDRIVGYMASPLLITQFGENNSAGRCQSPAIRMIVERDNEIAAFEPEEYWHINVGLYKNDLKNFFSARYQGDIKNEETAFKIKKELEEDSYIVISVENKDKIISPKPPFNTASLCSVAAGKLKFAANRTMAAAQKIFEMGMITYHRSDSFHSDPAAIKFAREYLKINNLDIPDQPNIYKQKENNSGHEAIRPTSIENVPKESFLTGDELKIYTLIWQRFLASQMKPAIYHTSSVLIETGNQHKLKATGKVLFYKGWQEIYEDDNDKDNSLPILEKGNILKLVKDGVRAEQKFTQPPPHINEKSLIEELEKRGIGRPSTYGAITNKITDRNYVVRNDNSFESTEQGQLIVNKLKESFSFIDYKYTARMENQLDQLEAGKISYIDVMKEFFTKFSKELKEAHIIDKTDYGYKCHCGERMYLRMGSWGYYLASNCYKEHKSSLACNLVDGKPVLKKSFDEKKIDTTFKCPICDGPMWEKSGMYGPYFSCTGNPIKCRGTRKKTVDKNCDKCGNLFYITAFNGELKLACTGYPDCKHIIDLPDNIKKEINWIGPSKIQVDMKIGVKKILEKKIPS